MLTTRNLYQTVKQTLGKISSLLFSQQQQDIIFFSHLRWDFIFQRPQQLATWLAKQNRILFIEEPISFHPVDRGKTTMFFPQKNITVLQPKIAVERIKEELPLVIAKQIRMQKMQNPILWFYSPLFSDIISMLNHSLIVYDFLNSEQLVENIHEQYLFSVADIIFASERSFFENQKVDLNTLHYLPHSLLLQETVVSQLQKILQKKLMVKKHRRLHTLPFYHAITPQLTVGR